MADVHIPGIGNVPRGAMIAAIAAGAGIVGYAWWKHRAGLDSTATDTTATDTATVDTSGEIDPSTGVPYADEYGYGYSGLGLGSGYYTDPTTGVTIGSGYGPTTLAPATTNSAWAQQVEATLSALGYDPITVSAAIGKYLLGAQVTSDQAAIIQAAIGQQGYPPEGALPIHTQSTSTPPATTSGTLPAPARVFAAYHDHTSIRLGWDRVSGAAKYRIDGKGAGGAWQYMGTSGDNQFTIHGLKRGTKHTFRVAAVNSSGKVGNYRSVSASTTK